MAIKLPKTMVYYHEAGREADYLLCWIPPDHYANLAEGNALTTLQKYYPNGLEVEVSQEALAAYGLQLAAAPDDLRAVYAQLYQDNLLNQSGMIAAEELERLARRHARGGDATLSLATGPTRSNQTVIDRIQKPPDMVGEEEADNFFKRLAGLPTAEEEA